MDNFSFRLLPPRADFAATLTARESAVMQSHFNYVQGLHAKGQVIFVGRTEGGEYGFGVLSAPDMPAARALIEADPSVASGLMHYELHPFRVVFDGKTGN